MMLFIYENYSQVIFLLRGILERAFDTVMNTLNTLFYTSPCTLNKTSEKILSKCCVV